VSRLRAMTVEAGGVPLPRSAYNVTLRDDMPGQLYFFNRGDIDGPVPEDQAQLQIEFDKVNAVLRSRLKDRDAVKFDSELKRLLSLAHGAFAGQYAQVAQARANLDAYKEELIKQEGPAIKNAYQRELAWAAGKASFMLLCVGLIIRITIGIGRRYGWLEERLSEREVILANAVRWDADFAPLHFAVLLAAAMWGIWLSFSVRSLQLRFEQLQHPESDMMRPWARLLTYGMLAFVLALFFQLGILVISVGGVVSTNQISGNVLVAIFVGLCLGFSDRALPDQVQQKIDEFFQSGRMTG
jgi:hypothetical protein